MGFHSENAQELHTPQFHLRPYSSTTDFVPPWLMREPNSGNRKHYRCSKNCRNAQELLWTWQKKKKRSRASKQGIEEAICTKRGHHSQTQHEWTFWCFMANLRVKNTDHKMQTYFDPCRGSATLISVITSSAPWVFPPASSPRPGYYRLHFHLLRVALLTPSGENVLCCCM